MSAESKRLSPASRQMSTMRVASATSLLPQPAKNSPLPPKVPVPKLSAGTFKPEPPSDLYSMAGNTCAVAESDCRMSAGGRRCGLKADKVPGLALRAAFGCLSRSARLHHEQCCAGYIK